jgi:uncharacterized protein (TIGR03000 family)
MYSVMLAAMLTTTSATPEWGCYGCSGCHGYSFCHGCSCGGYGYGYNAFSYGCSCYGCSCSGCWGCSGCYGCYGCSGCYGVVVSSSCFCSGCSGYGCCGGVVVSTSGVRSVGASGDAHTKALEEQVRALQEQNRQMKEMMQRMGPGKPGGGKPGKPEETSTSAPAHVVVKLPDEARLFVDDQPCPLTTATRSFDTPTLEPGRVYYYTIRAEVTRAGKPVTESKRVTLRAGTESVVEFGDMTQLVTAGR